MELATCEVRLNGDMLNTVIKPMITPAELVVLRAIHGAESVVKLRVHAMNKRPHQTELSRLRDAYDRPNDQDGFSVDKLYPSAANIPITFKEIGAVEDEGEDAQDAEQAAELEEITPIKSAPKAKKGALKPVEDDFKPFDEASEG